MTISELKAMIVDLPDDMPVHLMTQPTYPLEYEVANCITTDDFNNENENENVFYLCEGENVGYGSRDAWQ